MFLFLTVGKKKQLHIGKPDDDVVVNRLDDYDDDDDDFMWAIQVYVIPF